MKKKFEVKIYYSSFCTYEVEAENEAGAILKARDLTVIKHEIISNIENWKEADSAFEIKNEKVKN
jgi:hypothetical protein